MSPICFDDSFFSWDPTTTPLLGRAEGHVYKSQNAKQQKKLNILQSKQHASHRNLMRELNVNLTALTFKPQR